MSALANLTATLASAVADDATVAVAYPSGFTQAMLIGSTGGGVVINGDISLDQGDPGAEFTFGASTITITNRSGASWAAGSTLIASFGDYPRKGSYNLTTGTEEGQAAEGGAGDIQELTASGAVAAGIRILELNHATVAIAATMVATDFKGLFIVRDTSASGTAAHTVTLTGGTWDGTNDVATLNAPAEALVVYFDGNGRGQVVENTGAVAFS